MSVIAPMSEERLAFAEMSAKSKHTPPLLKELVLEVQRLRTLPEATLSHRAMAVSFRAGATWAVAKVKDIDETLHDASETFAAAATE